MYKIFRDDFSHKFKNENFMILYPKRFSSKDTGRQRWRENFAFFFFKYLENHSDYFDEAVRTCQVSSK